jgi:hypothetical protein
MTLVNFFHIEAFARGGDGGVGFVLAEVAREPNACLHVTDPRPPTELAGWPLAEFRIETARLTEAAREMRKGRERAVRSTQKILIGSVASYPVPCVELDGPEKYELYLRWRGLAVAFLASLAPVDAAIYSIVEHTDERFPHLHLVAVPIEASMRAKWLHPGYAARMTAQADGERAGLTAKEASSAGRRAYGRAMRALQDRYHREVGGPCGHSRLLVGRARSRLKRGEALAVRAMHDARDEAAAARDRAERDRARIVAAAEQEGYDLGHRAGMEAVTDTVDVLRRDLADATRHIAMLNALLSEKELNTIALEDIIAVLHGQLADVSIADDETVSTGYNYGR